MKRQDLFSLKNYNNNSKHFKMSAAVAIDALRVDLIKTLLGRGYRPFYIALLCKNSY